MRARNLVLLSSVVAAGAIAFVVLSSSGALESSPFGGGDERTRNDAMLFLARYDQLDVDDPIDQRRPLVESLEAMPFATPEVDRARDFCVDAHRALILAEERGIEARAAFDRASEGGRIEEPDIPTETRASIESALTESNDALARAREQLPRCMREARDLGTRFRPRRRSQR
ncbi:MAG: hypothetical protein M3Y87_34075 [Myxococcota bacterium]|nr:hypothetical protein [Myxococcota bacterium]